jgi:hypothetical protein
VDRNGLRARNSSLLEVTAKYYHGLATVSWVFESSGPLLDSEHMLGKNATNAGAPPEIAP